MFDVSEYKYLIVERVILNIFYRHSFVCLHSVCYTLFVCKACLKSWLFQTIDSASSVTLPALY